MTLQMRNDIINEEVNYLTYMQSVGAIIGEAKCEFRPEDNPQDNIALGQFVWSIEATVTPPMKFAELQVAFSQAGYSVYYK
jgi:phage tail sheath protein FI